MEFYKPDPLAVNEAVFEESVFLDNPIKIEYPLEDFEHDSNTDFESSRTKVKLEMADHHPVLPIKQEKKKDEELRETASLCEESVLGLPGPTQSFETALSVKEGEGKAVKKENQHDEVTLETNNEVYENSTIVAVGQQMDPDASLQRSVASEDHPLLKDLKEKQIDERKKMFSGKPFQCGVCEKRFSFISKLKIHENLHTREDLNQCDECGKRFSQKGYLKLHMRVHTREKPFKCDQCEMRFSHSTSLKNHLSIHLTEKPFKCDLCGKTFTLNSSLKNHQSVHTGEKRFKCDVCEQKFTRSFTLKTHKRIHAGEKPFQCENCKERFTDIGTLKRHRRTHAEVKLFKCDVCEKRFSRNYTLKKHRRKHTGVKTKV